MSKEHKLQVPYYEVVGMDKDDYGIIQMKYKNRPDPVEWAIKYFNQQNHNVFDKDESEDTWFNRVGDTLDEMFQIHDNGTWTLTVTTDGQVEGCIVECNYVTSHKWND